MKICTFIVFGCSVNYNITLNFVTSSFDSVFVLLFCLLRIENKRKNTVKSHPKIECMFCGALQYNDIFVRLFFGEVKTWLISRIYVSGYFTCAILHIQTALQTLLTKFPYAKHYTFAAKNYCFEKKNKIKIHA